MISRINNTPDIRCKTLEHVDAHVRITPARSLEAETADIPETLYDVHFELYRSSTSVIRYIRQYISKIKTGTHNFIH